MSEFDRASILDADFALYQRDNPDITFTRFYWQRHLDLAKDGTVHASIGEHLYSGLPWRDAGASQFKIYQQRVPVGPTERVLDYGCGTLRVGVQYIRFLAPGCYFGIDPVPGMIDEGRRLLGNELIRSKAPQLCALSSSSMIEGVRFEADLIISTSVCFHVPPEEIVAYLSNIARLAAKPGARVIFDARFGVATQRIIATGAADLTVPVWCYPLSVYVDSLAPLELVKIHGEAQDSYFPNGKRGDLEFLSLPAK